MSLSLGLDELIEHGRVLRRAQGGELGRVRMSTGHMHVKTKGQLSASRKRPLLVPVASIIWVLNDVNGSV